MLSVDETQAAVVDLNGSRILLVWVGEGWPATIRRALAAVRERRAEPVILAARRMSPGARALAAEGGVGWVDETGAAEIALPGIVISRSGRADADDAPPQGWTPATLTVSEVLLTGTPATVAACRAATSLSEGACTKALGVLTRAGLLITAKRRGPASGRRIADRTRLLEEYARAYEGLRPRTELRCGALWRDRHEALRQFGRRWERAGLGWAATGQAAAEVLAPVLTGGEVAEVLVAVKGAGALERAALDANVRPMEGGRLVLRPFVAPATARLVQRREGLMLPPWPTIFADLRRAGVRGEEAAEHLREVCDVP